MASGAIQFGLGHGDWFRVPVRLRSKQPFFTVARRLLLILVFPTSRLSVLDPVALYSRTCPRDDSCVLSTDIFAAFESGA